MNTILNNDTASRSFRLTAPQKSLLPINSTTDQQFISRLWREARFVQCSRAESRDSRRSLPLDNVSELRSPATADSSGARLNDVHERMAGKFNLLS